MTSKFAISNWRGVEWSRNKHFNWTFDNCGQTPLQIAVCGLKDAVTLVVQGNQVVIPELSGGGKVYYVRGVWKTDVTFPDPVFPEGDFWMEPESGTNYYPGGSFTNSGNQTIITLGTPLANGTEVQVYYIYTTGATAAKHDDLNSFPCVQLAKRSSTDFDYRYAPDRLFDLAAALYFGGRGQNIDPAECIHYLWDKYLPTASGVDDPYPYLPRFSILYNEEGLVSWRGPTIVHYSHPLFPYLAGRQDVAATAVSLHANAQSDYTSRYGGLPGPIMPVHTRNDIENIALCGEENFNRFCWWSKYRDYGKKVACWRFNETLTDALGTHTFTMTTGSPVWGTGVCQPGNTALTFDGTSKHATTDGTDFDLSGDFTVEMVAKINVTSREHCFVGKWNQTGNQRSWVFYMTAYGYLSFAYSTTGADYPAVYSDLRITDTNWHHIGVMRQGNVLTFFKDGQTWSTAHIPTYFTAAAPLRLGATQGGWPQYLNGAVDYAAIHKGRTFSTAEIQDRWQIIQGLKNGSSYPEVGYCLGQFWSFYRLGEYYFVSNDPAAWEILDKWLTWFQTMVVSDGAGGYKFPIWFHEYGYNYDTDSAFSFDAGGAASVVIGALYIYMRNGDARALDLAQKLLADLRLNRTSGDYGGYLYKSDYHYAWLNALVAHAFGLAVVGRTGAAYVYPFTQADETHFVNIMNNFWAMSGDTKPALLNSDLVPYHVVEAQDTWNQAPFNIFMKEMGSVEGVVLMMHAAIDWGMYSGSWRWFNDLMDFTILTTFQRKSRISIEIELN